MSRRANENSGSATTRTASLATLLALVATFYTIIQSQHDGRDALRRDIETSLRREMDLACACCRKP